jgi:hypothetical protein
MSEFMDVINAFGTPLKLAWVGWVAWGVGQYFWFRHERSAPSVRKVVTPVAKPVAKKVAAPRTVATQAAEAPVVGRLITPTHVAADAKPVAPVEAQPHAEPVVVPPPMPVSVAADMPEPAFDPSKAVIEQFGVTDSDSVLDKFVRDFEMQDARPRRRRPTRPSEPPSYGAEAPHVQ